MQDVMHYCVILNIVTVTTVILPPRYISCVISTCNGIWVYFFTHKSLSKSLRHLDSVDHDLHVF